MEGVVEVAEVGGEGVGLGSGDELVAFFALSAICCVVLLRLSICPNSSRSSVFNLSSVGASLGTVSFST